MVSLPVVRVPKVGVGAGAGEGVEVGGGGVPRVTDTATAGGCVPLTVEVPKLARAVAIWVSVSVWNSGEAVNSRNSVPRSVPLITWLSY